MDDALGQSQGGALVETVPGALDLAIVVLNYNTADLLRNCLRSVFSSKGDISYSVCVVDNASTDDSVDIVQREFPQVHLIANTSNLGYSAGNNRGLRWFGFGDVGSPSNDSLPRFLLLLNPDTVLPPHALAEMVQFLDDCPTAGVAGPRVMRPDGSLDRACRRSFPTPKVSLYRMTGLSRLFPQSKRFNAYNLEYLPEDGLHQVDSVVGAFMMVRREAIQQVGLLDESFFMYGEDLDWAKRIKDAGWENWYNGSVEITHVKEASSRQSIKSRIDFYEAMWIFYRKHYQRDSGWLTDKLIRIGVVGKGSLDVGRHFWRFCSVRENEHIAQAKPSIPHDEEGTPQVVASARRSPKI
jgi:N-acetylglucosaminyl-diphospho-decaprenol L-rhamnosyltransferase